MRLAFLLPFSLLAGCGLLGPKPSDEMPHCEDTRTAIALDAVTSLGFSAEEVLAGVPQEEHTSLVYDDGVATDLTVGFAPVGGAYFVDSVEVYPEGGMTMDIGIICQDRIEIDGMFPFATADGAFSESFAATLYATEEAVGITHALELDNLNGSFDIEPFVDAEDYDELSASISVIFVDGVSSGTVSGTASGQEECSGNECSAWAEAVDVGSWPGPGIE